MAIAWDQFTPAASLGGGMLIGLSAALFILLNGRIAGISGILGGVLRPRAGDLGWRLCFLLGLASAALFLPLPTLQVAAGTPVLIAAGLLVGLGTRYGSGCTSGHGVCGIARLSPRSLAATGVFMAAGMATVYLTRHVL